MMTSKKMQVHSIYISDDDWKALDIIHKRTRTGKSAIIREGIQRALKAYEVLLERKIEVEVAFPFLQELINGSKEKDNRETIPSPPAGVESENPFTARNDKNP
jgi:hypothetical protein